MTINFKEGLGLFIYSIVALVAGFISLFFNCHSIAWIAIFLSDIYLIALLYVAAKRVDYECKNKQKNFMTHYPSAEYLFPNLKFALLIFLFFLLAIVLGFAGLYVGTNDFCPVKNQLGAFYTSLFIMGFDNPNPASETGKLIVITQFFSSLLLLVGVFPLLISRIASYKSNH